MILRHPKGTNVAPNLKKEKIAFVASALYIVGMLVGAAFALYPVVLPSSSDPRPQPDHLQHGRRPITG